MRYARIVHELAGRIRFRTEVLRENAERVSALADSLQRLEGMERVELRPFSGSVLCEFDPYVLSKEALEATLKEALHLERVFGLGEEGPRNDVEETSRARSQGSRVAQAASRFFRDANLDLLRATKGEADLGTATAFTFLSAGVVEVLVSRRLPIPPWFNLAWWALRTFTTFEKTAMRSAEASPDPVKAEPGTT